MRIFEKPEMRISRFMRENILTESSTQQQTTAVEKAVAAADNIANTAGTFIVDIG